MPVTTRQLNEAMLKIEQARHHDPFSVLGPHQIGVQQQILVYLPQAHRVSFAHNGVPLARHPDSDFFSWTGPPTELPLPYELVWYDHGNNPCRRYDPYCFVAQLPDFDLDLFSSGRHRHIYRFLGAHPWQVNGIKGILFATWAPNAERVSVVGDFNQWDGRIHPLRNRGSSGVWELFIPGVAVGALYKFELRHLAGGLVSLKADPYAQQFELRPSTASVVTAADPYPWQDQRWMTQRQQQDWLHQPLSIYEVHLGSWQRTADNGMLNYRELAHRLVAYCQQLGFNALELLPITEHPLDASWGYQTLGFFAPTRRFGTADDFRYFVDHCHAHNIAVFLDWVPGHFPKDAHGLARFDGSALYEHDDPRRGEHRDWGTLIFNFGRNEVRNFLLSSAVFWLEEMHLDGLRVDAVASMLYLDYSRTADDWTPNIYGGNENLEAIAFLQELNAITHGDFPGTLTIAEESTAWPQVTRPTWLGGLGFTMKWNMGWMHDTLVYLSKNSIHRHYHHDQLTFGLLYAFTENFVLPFSHDEVVHGKSSMLNKMPGDEWQRFANLRALYAYMFTYPGKKLLFMGNEFGQGDEWRENKSLDWYVLDYPLHQGLQRLVGDLNRLYIAEPALHRYDFQAQGFEWIDCHDAAQSIISYIRKGDNEEMIIVVINFTPVPRFDYRIGVPRPCTYHEVINSDSEHYGGSNLGNLGLIQATTQSWMGRPYSITLTLPPLAVLIIKAEP